MGLGNLLTQLYNQLNPFVPGSGSDSGSGSGGGSLSYTCQGYVEDLRELRAAEEIVARLEKLRGNYPAEAEQALARANDHIREVKNCLDPSNLISGGGTSDPNIGLYIAIGVGVVAGVGGLAYYLKKRSKKSEKTSQ